MTQHSLEKTPASSSRLLWLVSAAVGVPAVVIAQALEPDLALTALSAWLFVAAAVAGALALLLRAAQKTARANLWDVAGGLVLTGCAASVFGEPENVALLFEHLFERRAATQ